MAADAVEWKISPPDAGGWEITPPKQAPASGFTGRLKEAFTPEAMRILVKPDREIQGALRMAVEGVNKGIADTLGLPADIVNMTFRGFGGQGQPMPGGGAEWHDLFKRLGFIGKTDAKNIGERMVEYISRVAGGGGAVAGGVAVASKAAKGSGAVSQILQDIAKDPRAFLARELDINVGAGVGGSTAKEVAPDSPTAEVAGQLAGGGGTALLQGRAPTRIGQAGKEQIVANVMRDASSNPRSLAPVKGTDYFPTIEAGQRTADSITGMRPTTAQASQDRGLLGLERGLRGEQQFSGRLSDRLAHQREATMWSLAAKRAGIELTPEQAGAIAREGIEGSRSRMKDTRRGVYEGVDFSAETDAGPMFDAVKKIVTSVREGDDPASMPNAVTAFVTNEKRVKSLDDLQSWSSRVNKELREEKAQPAPDKTKIARLSQFNASIQEVIDQVPSKRYRSGQALAKREAATFDTGPVGEAMRGGQVGGTYSTPDSRVPQIFLRTPESFRALAKATGSKSTAVKAVQNVYQQQLERAAKSSTSLTNFITTNRPVLTEAFGRDHVNNMLRIRDAMRLGEGSSRPGIPGQSNTFEKFSAQRWLDRAIGGAWRLKAPLTARAVKGAADVFASGSDAKIMRMLQDAMLDPDLAKALLTRVTDREAERAGQRIHSYLATLGEDE